MPRKDRSRLLALCEDVPVALADVVSDPGKPVHYVYFPIDGFISMVAVVEGSPGVEVGMVGREGILGAHVALGVATAPFRALVQGVGSARRIGVVTFRKELTHNAALQQGVNHYLYVLLSQLATSAACYAFI